MAVSKAATVSAYLAALPPERRKVIAAVRALIRKNLPKGYAESMDYGMICYVVPLGRYPDTYNCKALCYAALAAQKHYVALYLMDVYLDPAKAKALKAAFAAAGKKADMGKSCVRFTSLDDLPLDTIARLIAATPVDAFIASMERARRK